LLAADSTASPADPVCHELGPCIVVKFVMVSTRFLLAILKKVLEVVSFSSQMCFTSNKQLFIACQSYRWNWRYYILNDFFLSSSVEGSLLYTSSFNMHHKYWAL